MDDKKFKNRLIMMIQDKISEMNEARRQPGVGDSVKRDIDNQIKGLIKARDLAEKIDAQVEG